MSEDASKTTDQRMCVTCGKIGGTCRWTDDAEACMRKQLDELRTDVIAFCAPWAASYAADHGFPPNHLHPTHYDILAKCGARMTSFVRGEITNG